MKTRNLYILKYQLILLVISAMVITGCEKTDNTQPEIELVGELYLEHILNEPYTDAGVSVSDDLDGDIEAVMTSNLNVDKTGTYQIRWTAVDEAGNSAFAIRIVTVVNEADWINGEYSGINTFPSPGGNPDSIDAEVLFADSLTNNTFWFSNFSGTDSLFIAGSITDSGNFIFDQKVSVMTDTIVEYTYNGTFGFIENQLLVNYLRKSNTDSVAGEMVLFRNLQ